MHLAHTHTHVHIFTNTLIHTRSSLLFTLQKAYKEGGLLCFCVSNSQKHLGDTTCPWTGEEVTPVHTSNGKARESLGFSDSWTHLPQPRMQEGGESPSTLRCGEWAGRGRRCEGVGGEDRPGPFLTASREPQPCGESS